jgi:hypothetical protein
MNPTNEPKDVEAGTIGIQDDLTPWIKRINAAVGYTGESDTEDVISILKKFRKEAQAHTHTDTIATIRAKLPKDALAVRQDWQGLNWLDGCNDVINLVNALLTRLERRKR